MPVSNKNYSYVDKICNPQSLQKIINGLQAFLDNLPTMSDKEKLDLWISLDIDNYLFNLNHCLPNKFQSQK